MKKVSILLKRKILQSYIVSVKNILFGCNCGQRYLVRASFTVEAAVIVPMILFTIAGGINIGYDMFQDVKKSTIIEEELIKLDPVDIVRKRTMIMEIGEDN